jgi:hypothetical protein
MVSRTIIASALLLGTLVPAPFAMQGDKDHSQSAIVSFQRPTWVAGEMLVGTYLIVHDEDKMARGEPCTALYRMGTQTRSTDAVVAFHCIPHDRRVVPGFTTTVMTNPAGNIDVFDTLTEFQFAGDGEGHGVPIGATLASDSPPPSETAVCFP